MIIDIVYGFIGAGKTTFIRRILDNPPDDEKLAVLVNEFGEIGIDGRILKSHGKGLTEIVEMESGCICCTLAADFPRQIIELNGRYSPDRMIIEPTGLANIKRLMEIFEREDVKRLYSDIRLIHIVDSSEFLSFIKANRSFTENQIRAGNIIILNKTDRIKPRMADLLIYSIKEINPKACVYPTGFSEIAPVFLTEILGEAHKVGWAGSAHPTGCGNAKSLGILPFIERSDPQDYGNFESFSRRFPAEIFDSHCLEFFFKELCGEHYGEAARAKGIFRTHAGWILMELASGVVRTETGPAGEDSLISIIGRSLNAQELESRLKACRSAKPGFSTD